MVMQDSYQNNTDELLLTEALKSTGFLVINRRLIRILGLIDAAFLSYYIDTHNYYKQKSKDYDGWFYCTHEKQKAHLNVTEYTIRQTKKKLLDSGILTIKQQGVPSKEWYKIDFQILKSVFSVVGLDLTNSQGLDITNSQGLDLTNSSGLYNKTKNNNTVDNKTKNKTNCRQEKLVDNDRFFKCALHLSKTIKKKRNMEFTKSQLIKWSHEVKKLNTSNKVSFDRIKRALKWYRNNIGVKYVPDIQSGRSFKEKFIKLEAAIERSNNTYERPTEIDYIASVKDKTQRQKLYDCLPDPKFNKSINDLFVNICRVREENNVSLKTQPSPAFLIEKYIHWLESKDWIRDLKAGHFYIEGSSFNMFLKDYFDENFINPILNK